jgi:hypothetical protein
MRLAKVAALTALLGMVVVAGTAGAEEVRVAKPNLIGGELGGRGVFCTGNYERYFAGHLGAGVGIVPGSPVWWTVYLSYLPGDVRSLYLSAGVTVVTLNVFGEEIGGPTPFHVAVGYQYQSPGGFVIRPFGMLWFIDVNKETHALPWAGLTIARSF